jgi:hypothetical protein
MNPKETINKSSLCPASFPRRVMWHIMLGFTLYWVGNILVIFPWLFSKTLGIITMFLSTFLWGYIVYYCLKHAPKKDWNKDTISMALSFLITAVIQDYFLYVIYRGIPDELYELTTFLAYGLVFLMPFIVRYVFFRKYNVQAIKEISNKKLIVTFTIGLISLFLTLWSVKFW